MPLYSITETRKNTHHIILKRTFELWKASEKHYYFEYTITDLFDCELNFHSGTISFSSKQQEFLERGIRKGKLTPIELFSTEEFPLYHNKW